MLSFDLRALDAHAIAVDGVLPPDDAVWIESDPRPAAEGIRVTGRLSTAGPGRYYFSGALAGAVDAECRRCLTDVRAPVEDEELAELCALREPGKRACVADDVGRPLVQGTGGGSAGGATGVG